MTGPDECWECGYDELNCRCDEDDDDWDCTHCGGEGMCRDGIACDPLWYTGEHYCHACNGTGRRRDQVIF